MVKRYCLVGKMGSLCNCAIKEHNIGAFVSSRDYDSLERERDALRALVMRVAEGKCICTMSQRLTGDGCEVCNPQMAIEIARENAEGADHDI